MSDADTFIDSTRAVRSGEELDDAALRAFFASELNRREQPKVSQFPGGHSNLTYLVGLGDDEFVLRKPPRGSKVKSAHDMGREYRVLSKLWRAFPLAPQPLAYCDDESVLGAPFYVMERRRGIILRKTPPAGLDLGPSEVRTLCERFIDALATLHSLDYEAIGLGDLGKPAGYIERQVSGWTRRYEGSKTNDLPVVLRVAQWLAAHRPAESSPALIHNDFKFDNLVLSPEDPTKIIGILDWEMATLGDPLMDVGTALSYWVEANDSQPMQMMRFGPTTLDGMFSRAELAAAYSERTGRSLKESVFFYAFGLFKTAVVAQQIYYRYAQGLTKDPRFAQFIFAVEMLANQAEQAIESGHI